MAMASNSGHEPGWALTRFRVVVQTITSLVRWKNYTIDQRSAAMTSRIILPSTGPAEENLEGMNTRHEHKKWEHTINFRMPGIDRDLEAFVALSLEMEHTSLPFRDPIIELCSSRTEKDTSILLTLRQGNFGIKNSCTGDCSSTNGSCSGSCCPLFIHDMTIQVCPKSWADNCDRLDVEPRPTPEVFREQRTFNSRVDAPLVDPRRALISFETGKIFSREAHAFGWKPANLGDYRSNLVTWTWKFSRFTDGSELKFNKQRYGIPEFGYRPNFLQLQSESLMPKVSWVFFPNNEKLKDSLKELHLDIKVTLHIAMIQQKQRWYKVKEALIFNPRKPLVFL